MTTNVLSPLTLADVLKARRVLTRYLPTSPLVVAPVLSEQLGCIVYLKLDCMLPTGAFKVRGGIYLLSQLTPGERARGIVAATRGNHGQSLAYACRMFGAPCQLFVPRGNSLFKNAAMRRLAALVVESGNDFDESCDMAAAFAAETGAMLVHPGENHELFAGVGTWAVEALEQVPTTIDAAFVPVGVGSCLIGSIPAFESMSPRTALIGVSAEAAPAFAKSIESRQLHEIAIEPTLADGLAVRRPPEMAVRSVLDSKIPVVQASEPDICAAMRDLIIHEGIVAEGASATALVAARDFVADHKCEGILLMMTGRNVDSRTLKAVLSGNGIVKRTFVAT